MPYQVLKEDPKRGIYPTKDLPFFPWLVSVPGFFGLLSALSWEGNGPYQKTSWWWPPDLGYTYCWLLQEACLTHTHLFGTHLLAFQDALLAQPDSPKKDRPLYDWVNLSGGNYDKTFQEAYKSVQCCFLMHSRYDGPDNAAPNNIWLGEPESVPVLDDTGVSNGWGVEARVPGWGVQA